MTYEAVIISPDVVFSRMLALELDNNNIRTVCVYEVKTDISADIYVIDRDSVSERETTASSLKEGKVVSFSYNYEKIFEKNAEGNVLFKRPFLICDFKAAVSELLEGEAKHTPINLGPVHPVSADMIKFTRDGIRYMDRDIKLTRREYRLLSYLMENRGNVVSREDAVKAVWNYNFTGNTNVVDVYIRYLREKLEGSDGGKIIYTIRNRGYLIK